MNEPLQIPWATNIKAERNGPELIKLTSEGGSTAIFVSEYSDFYMETNSAEIAKQTMVVDDFLTESLQHYLETYDEDFNTSVVREWISGRSPDTRVKRGVLEWRPIDDIKKIGKQVDPGNTSANELWNGDSMEYVRFRTMDCQDAIVLKPDQPAKAEVWIGDVDSFFIMQSLDLREADDLLEVNSRFDNTILWASYMVGEFQDPDLIGDPWVEVIYQDPDILFPELVNELLPMRKELPEKLDKALGTWLRNRQREIDEAVGQRFIWPGLPKQSGVGDL